jgi:hypothetical protein
MPYRDGLVEWCQGQRATLAHQLEMMRSGAVKTHERRGTVVFNTTSESMARIERQMAKLDEVIARRLSTDEAATSGDVGPAS